VGCIHTAAWGEAAAHASSSAPRTPAAAMHWNTKLPHAECMLCSCSSRGTSRSIARQQQRP
jgi:hypothetical protein